MASSLSITKQLNADKQWEITAEVVAGGTLPLDIFVYENTGTTTLGQYQAVCGIEEYQRFQTLTDTAIPKFGNRFVKSTQAKIKVDIDTDPTLIITNIIESAKALSLALAGATSSTQIVIIP